MLNNTEQKSEPNCWVQLQSTIMFHLLESNFVPKRAFKENRVIRWRDAQREIDGGPQVGEVTRLAVVENENAFTCSLTTPRCWGEVS